MKLVRILVLIASLTIGVEKVEAQKVIKDSKQDIRVTPKLGYVEIWMPGVDSRVQVVVNQVKDSAGAFFISMTQSPAEFKGVSAVARNGDVELSVTDDTQTVYGKLGLHGSPKDVYLIIVDIRYKYRVRTCYVTASAKKTTAGILIDCPNEP